MSSGKKTRNITIRVSDVEYMKISSGANSLGMNISQYINFLAHLKYMETVDKHLLCKK